MDSELLCRQITSLAETDPGYVPLLSNAAALLWDALEDVNWAGFYLMRGGRLVLGPFQGKTACIHIPVGKGVCGTAVEQDRTQRVADVHAFPGHIACDAASRSEIVVPLHRDGRVVGVLDIDSPSPDRFSEADQAGLEAFVRALEGVADFADLAGEPPLRSAYFAGGCFWCITPDFAALDGVVSVTSGYSGGDEPNPAYEDVKAQRTGHRETIRVDYDPAKVSYAALLDTFLDGVDPFDAGGQFIDRGRSYTLAVYPQDEAERDAALACLRRLEAEEGKPAAIAVEPFKAFYPAEEHHQDYYLKNPEAFQRELMESGRMACPRRKRKKRD